MVDGNKLGEIGFKYLGVSYSQMDCQAFWEQCLRDCGCDKNLSGSNAWIREIMNHGWVGTPEECIKEHGKIPKGATLFILEQNGKEPSKYQGDGIGNASHMGIVTMPDGEGAIHSSASKGCVCESKFQGKTIKNGGWNRVGLWDNVSYRWDKEKTDPIPSEEFKMGEVFASNGKPVNFRKRPSTSAALIDKISCGDKVEILENQGKWCKIKWHKITGYMMTEFIIFEEDLPDEQLYCVTIHDLPQLLAEEIVGTYGGSITKEIG